MKLAIIYRAVTLGGVETVLTNVIQEIEAISEVRNKILVLTDSPEKFKKVNLQTVRIPKAPKLFQDLIYIPFLLIRVRATDVLYTKNIIPITHFLLPVRKHILVHDIAFYYSSLKAYKLLDTLYMRAFFYMSLRLAETVLTVSFFTKSEIVRRFPQSKKKIFVAPLAVSSEILEADSVDVVSARNLRKPYLLYCGSLSPRKNVTSLLSAFSKISNEIPHQLVLVSGKSWKDSRERSLIEAIGPKRAIILENVSTKELANIYREADAFIYPSLYEGFGLPVIEAQAMGCLVGVLDTPVAREVAGNGAYYMRSVNAENLLALLNMPYSKQKILLKNGAQNYKKYSWRKTAHIICNTVGMYE